MLPRLQSEIDGNGNQKAGHLPGNVPAGTGRESGTNIFQKSRTGGNREPKILNSREPGTKNFQKIGNGREPGTKKFKNREPGGNREPKFSKNVFRHYSVK